MNDRCTVSLCVLVAVHVGLTSCAVCSDAAEPPRLTMGPQQPSNRALFGINCGVESDFTSEPILYSNASLRAALRALGVGAMRYPGGTPANFFDWRTSSYLSKADVVARLDAAGLAANCSVYKDCNEDCSCYGTVVREINQLPRGSFCPKNFASMVASAEVPTIVWQPDIYFSSQPTTAITMLHGSEVPVATLELSNEMYLSGYEQLFPNVSSFVARAQPVITAAKHLFPDATVAWPAFHTTIFLGQKAQEVSLSLSLSLSVSLCC